MGSRADDNLATKTDLAALRAYLRSDLAQPEQRTTMRTVTIVAILNAILFAARRYLPPPA